MESNVTVGSLLSTTLAVFLKRLPYLAVIAVIIYMPQMILTVWSRTRPEDAYLALIAFPLLMLGSFVAQGAITVATYHDLRGQGFGLNAGLSRTVSRFLPLLGLAIASWFMVMLGSMLLIIPGIMLQCALFVAIPALMVEDLNIGAAISRSFELTAGYRLRIFGLSILIGIVVMIPVFIIDFTLIFVMGEESLLFDLTNALLSGIAGSAGSVGAAVTYYRLREDVDGVGLEELEDVFA